MITNDKPLVAIFKKDVAILSQRLEEILLHIHQYNIRILHKPGLQLFIAGWFSRHNHDEGKDEEIPGMSLDIDTIGTCAVILKCMTADEIRHTTQEDNHTSELTTYMIHGFPSTKAEVKN